MGIGFVRDMKMTVEEAEEAVEAVVNQRKLQLRNKPGELSRRAYFRKFGKK
jgi:hypothetical protein